MNEKTECGRTGGLIEGNMPEITACYSDDKLAAYSSITALVKMTTVNEILGALHKNARVY